MCPTPSTIFAVGLSNIRLIEAQPADVSRWVRHTMFRWMIEGTIMNGLRHNNTMKYADYYINIGMTRAITA